jgi:hypothetical protein
MNIDRVVLIFAGAMILTSLALAHFFTPDWLWLTALIGVVMFQSGITGFCPAALVFKKLGVKPGCAFR